MKDPPKNVVASVLARLRNAADKAGLTFNDVLQSYVIERFLARLARSQHADSVLLKGALLLRLTASSSGSEVIGGNTCCTNWRSPAASKFRAIGWRSSIIGTARSAQSGLTARRAAEGSSFPP